ncbi:hypothetical protein Taro_034153 [Colocasia esculenta]|uniref:Uncharacterized protein n=1 Tax=Colocasia esculenta TaxID=4460 RepID=A0A843VX26_COLES|nr:hypothetical protein [Colocasia esculenta]
MELPGFVPYLRTRQNLLQSPGSHRALRELPRELHHAATFPRAIRRRCAFYDRPTTARNLLETSKPPGREAGARGNESELRKLPSGEHITCRTVRLASTPLSPIATARLNDHIYCRLVQAINVHASGRQQSTATPWPPTQTEQQQILFYFRTNPALLLDKPHIYTKHSIQLTRIGLTTAATTTTYTIRMDPKSTRRYKKPSFRTPKSLFRLTITPFPRLSRSNISLDHVNPRRGCHSESACHGDRKLCSTRHEKYSPDGRQYVGLAEFCVGAEIPPQSVCTSTPICRSSWVRCGYLFAQRSEPPASPQFGIGTSTRSSKGRIRRFPIRHPNSSPRAWSRAADAVAYGHPFAQTSITFRSVIGIAYKTSIRNRHSETFVAPLLPRAIRLRFGVEKSSFRTPKLLFRPTISPFPRLSRSNISLDHVNPGRGCHSESACHGDWKLCSTRREKFSLGHRYGCINIADIVTPSRLFLPVPRKNWA